MARLITPEEASLHSWLVDLQTLGMWSPAFIRSAGDELLVARMENGTRKTETRARDTVEIEPTSFRCEVRYDSVITMLEGTLDSAKAALVVTSLTPDATAGLSDLHLYQLVNSSIPVFLNVAVNLAFKEKRFEEAEGFAVAAGEFLIRLIPRLVTERRKGCLDWFWPGVLETVQHVLKYFSAAPNRDSYLPQVLLLLQSLIDKILTLRPTEFHFADLAPCFPMLRMYMKTYPEVIKERMKDVARTALGLKSDISSSSELSVFTSLDSLFLLIQSEDWRDLLPAWADFLSSVAWSAWTNLMLDLLLKALEYEKTLAKGWKEKGLFGKILSKITTAEKGKLMRVLELVPELSLISELFPVSEAPLPLAVEIRNEHLFQLFEHRQWDAVQQLVDQGKSAGVFCEDRSHSFLLTLALGRSMPYTLVTSFFDKRSFENLIPFQMIASRYPEVEQIYLLTHLVSRKAVIDLLGKPDIEKSSAFAIEDVKTLLKNVLYRDRLLLLWLRLKIRWAERLPQGLVQSIVLEYVS